MYQSEDLYTEDHVDDNQETNYLEEQVENEVEEGEEEAGTERKVIKPKRVLKPRPKLDAPLLTGPKGLSAISGYFNNVKYKGKGHEEEDLNFIMKIYEHWCHRLFPKYPFDDCLKKIEILGNRRPIITHLKKIRMNLDEEEKNESMDEDEMVTTEEQDIAPIVELNKDPIYEQVNKSTEDHNKEPINNLFNKLTDEQDKEPIVLTEEQRERIRINQKRAKALLQKSQNSAFNNLNDPASISNCEENAKEEQIENNEHSQTKSQGNNVKDLNEDDDLLSQVPANSNAEIFDEENNEMDCDVDDLNQIDERLQMDDLLDEMDNQIEKNAMKYPRIAIDQNPSTENSAIQVDPVELSEIISDNVKSSE